MRPLFLSLLSLSLAAQDAPKANKPAAPAAQAAPQAPAAPAQKPEDIVLATVGAATITEADFQAVVAQMPQQQQMMVQIVQGAKEQLVNGLVERKLLALEGQKQGLEKSPEYLRGLAQTQDDLLAREYLRAQGPALQEKMKLSDADLQAYFKVHEKDFTVPAKATARHILVMVKGPATNGQGVSDEEAKAKVAMIQGKLKAKLKGSNEPKKIQAAFGALAEAYTDDPSSKPKGGLYENFDPKTMDPSFAKAVEAQPLGVVGEPVKSMYGYHLIEVEGRTPASQPTFEQAKDKVQEAASKARQEEVWKALIADLKKDFPVAITLPKPADPKPEAPAQPAAPKPAEKPAAKAPEAGK